MASLPPQSFTLESEHFILRPFTAADASEKLVGWSDDELASEMLNATRRRWSVEEQANYFESYAKNPVRRLLGILPKGEQHPIGLFRLQLHPQVGTFLISYLIGNLDWRGKGVTEETTDAIYDYLFNKLGYAKAKANVRPQNRPMLWAMLGRKTWQKEAHLVGHLRDASTGRRADLYVLGLLAEDWRVARKTAV
jgi:RimJ/RimL family protein N-acetyltransferase